MANEVWSGIWNFFTSPTGLVIDAVFVSHLVGKFLFDTLPKISLESRINKKLELVKSDIAARTESIKHELEINRSIFNNAQLRKTEVYLNVVKFIVNMLNDKAIVKESKKEYDQIAYQNLMAEFCLFGSNPVLHKWVNIRRSGQAGTPIAMIDVLSVILQMRTDLLSEESKIKYDDLGYMWFSDWHTYRNTITVPND